MIDKKQSSVEFIKEFLLTHCNPTVCDVEWSDFKLMLNQAKAMHKEEIAKAYDDAIMKGRQEDGNIYYNETFNSDEA